MMRAITIHVDDSAYRDFKKMAGQGCRSTSELIREAMDSYRRRAQAGRRSLSEAEPPASVGKILKPWTSRADLLDDFLLRS